MVYKPFGTENQCPKIVDYFLREKIEKLVALNVLVVEYKEDKIVRREYL